jgi:outer membrane autotransporter protein
MASAGFGARDEAQALTAWGQAFGSRNHMSGDGNAASLDDSLAGFIFGADATIDSHYRFGVAASYARSDLTAPQRDSSARIDSTSIGLYGGANQQALQLRAGGFYTFNHYNSTSNVAFPGFFATDHSGYDGGVLQAFGEAGWRIALPVDSGFSSWIEPFAGLLGLKLNTNSFAESGSSAALVGSSGTFGYGASTLGLRSEITLFDFAPVTLRAMMGWRQVFGALNPDASLAFAGATATSFTIYGAPLARSALATELGVNWRIGKATVLGISYSGLIGGGANDNAIKGKFEMAF